MNRDTTINTKDVVRDLGVYFDTELSMKQHIAKVAAVCFYHIRHLRQIRRRVGQAVTTRLVLAMITSRLDYCNSVLAGLPQSTLEPLQKVQNTAARLIFNLSHYDHISPCLMQLHWLPVRARVQYKLCSLMYGVHNNRCPSYISDIVQSTKTESLRSIPSQAAFKRQLKTFLFCDAFNVVYDEPWLFYIALYVCNAPMVFYYVMGALANF